MHEPRKLTSEIDYSNEAVLPEIDMELEEFVKAKHENLDMHKLHEELKDLGAGAIGNNVLLTEDVTIDESQFEEKIPQTFNDKPVKKSFIEKLFK